MSKNKLNSLYLNKLKFDKKLLKNPFYYILTNFRLLALAIISLVAAGVYSYATLPRELNPEVNIPIVNVITTLPGAGPTDVENLITEPIEKELTDLTGVDSITSSSRDSVSIITIQFQSNADPDEVTGDTKERVDLAKPELPDDAGEPAVQKLDFNDQPVLTVSITGELDRLSLSSIAKNLQDELESTRQIKKVSLSGDQNEEIVVEIKPETLETYNLDPNQIQSALTTNNINLPAGTITNLGLEYTLSVDNQFNSPADVRSLPISTRNGTITLGEVANVYYRTKDTNTLASYVEPDTPHQNAVELNIFKSQTTTISDSVDKAEQVLSQELEKYPGVSATTILNTAEEVEKSFAELGNNFASTIVLVFIVLFLFLGARQATIASLSIPLTFLSAFVIMNIMGITLNFLSLFSLLLALGLVVDDAIVIVQAISKYSQKFNPTETGLLVFRDFVVPIWTTTLTTVWAFVPLLLATGIIGEFIKSIPIVVTATLLSSTTIAVLLNLPLTVNLLDLQIPQRVKKFALFLAAITSALVATSFTAGSPLTPLVAILAIITFVTLYLARKQLRNQTGSFYTKFQNTNFYKRLSKFTTKINLRSTIYDLRSKNSIVDFDPFAARYEQFLIKTLKSKKSRLRVYFATGIFLSVSLLFLATGLLKNEFFPKTDTKNVYINIEAPAGTPAIKTQEIIAETIDIIEDIPEIESIASKTGSSFDPNGGAQSGANFATISIVLPDSEDRNRSSIEIADQIRNITTPITQASLTVFEPSGGPPAGADFQVNIKGQDLETLETISNDFMAMLGEVEGAININTSLKLSSGEIKVNLNQAALTERNLSAIQVAGWLRTALTGSEVSDLTIDSDDYDITINLDKQYQTLSYLQNLTLPSQMGSYTLSEIATLTLETSPSVINRQDGQRVVSVTAAASGIPSPEVLAAFQQKADDYQLPTGYTWDVGGANEENIESTRSIIQAMGLSVILILVTMVLQLASFRKAFLVLSVIPLAVAGVFFNFTIFGIPLSFPALIGVLALFGIVVNNSIMLVEKINQNLSEGFDFVKGIADACASRIEPILLTSLTTTLGLLPITISDPLWRGLGGAIIAGLTVSGALILVLLPTLFTEVYGKNNK